LAKNIEVSSTLYCDYLAKRHAFFKHLSAKVIIKKLWRLARYRESFDIIDLAYVEDIERNIMPMDAETIKNSPIKFYVRVFDPKTKKTKYLDAKEDTITRCIQSSKVPPYAYSNAKEDVYFDGGIMPCKDFLKTVKANPDKKIIYIFNDKKTPKRVTRYIMSDLLDILFKTVYLGLDYGLKHLFNIYNYTYVHDLKKYKNVHILYDETGNSKREKNVEKITEAFELGKKKGEQLLKDINFIK
jgi:predicted patatin/cPLA2 family phospholipase